MQRTVDIVIDETSWTDVGRVVPKELQPLTQTHQFDIFTTMLRLGVLTTPVRARGLSLNSFWAYIRYLGSFSTDQSMRLHPDFYNLDPHQKTILSDDFGVGFSMQFLKEKMNLKRMCDGMYFMQHFGQKRGLTFVSDPTVHGPQKCPDYICLGEDGKIHLVECKGTQTSRSARNQQIARGLEQKNSIDVVGPRSGEKLVSGLLIKKNTAYQNSELIICDPVDRSPSITIGEEDYQNVQDSIVLGDVARYLAASGMEDTSFFLASRLDDNSFMKNGDLKFTKKAYLEKPYSEDELTDTARHSFTVRGQNYLGREQTFTLPSSFMINGEKRSRVIVKAGIKRELAKSLKEQSQRRSSEGWPLFTLEKEFQDHRPSADKEQHSYGEIIESGIYASTIELE